jgi:hypothetical protein
MRGVLIISLCAIVLGGGGIALEIFLSKMENRWAGLILPLLTFLISLAAVMSIAAFSVTQTTETASENGVTIERTVSASVIRPAMEAGSPVVLVVSVFLLYNIPTAVLLAIYFACREKRGRRRALEKMSAQDLE